MLLPGITSPAISLGDLSFLHGDDSGLVRLERCGVCGFLCGVVVLVIELLFRGVFSRDSVRDTTPPTPKEKEEGTFGFLRVPDVWYCFMFFFFTSGAFGVLQSFSQTIFKNAYHLNLTGASAALTAYLLGAGAGALIGGFLTNQA